jgi:hypothetical protein
VLSSAKLIEKIYTGIGRVTRADLLNRGDYDELRQDLMGLVTKHKSKRRVRLDDNLSIVFENRLTAWLHAQEELSWLTRPNVHDIDDILDRTNQLVAAPGHLAATIFVDGAHRSAVNAYVAAIATHKFDLGVHFAGHIMQGQFVEAPHEGWNTVHPLQFSPTAREATLPEIVWGNDTPQAIPLPNVVQTALGMDLNRSPTPYFLFA